MTLRAPLATFARWIALVALLPALAACATGGNAASSRPSGATSQRESAMPNFVLRSPSLAPDGSIPRKYSCDGQNVSPSLEWEGAPGGTAAFALIMDDPDARGFVHWVLYNLTGSSSGLLPEAVSASPDAPPQGRNSFGNIGYGGPCPPSGTHHYRFTLYARSAPLQRAGAASADDVRAAVSPVLLDTATLSAPYTRQR